MNENERPRSNNSAASITMHSGVIIDPSRLHAIISLPHVWVGMGLPHSTTWQGVHVRIPLPHSAVKRCFAVTHSRSPSNNSISMHVDVSNRQRKIMEVLFSVCKDLFDGAKSGEVQNQALGLVGMICTSSPRVSRSSCIISAPPFQFLAAAFVTFCMTSRLCVRSYWIKKRKALFE